MTNRRQEAETPTEGIAPDTSARAPLGSHPEELIDRIEQLRTLLPAFAQETAVARREAARLRSENTTLQRRVIELETRSASTRDTTRDA
jgi:hypothetical protein